MLTDFDWFVKELVLAYKASICNVWKSDCYSVGNTYLTFSCYICIVNVFD